MASNRLRRIAKELADIQSDVDSKILAEAADGGSDLSHLHASFPGPPDTPYEGGTFVVDIKIPQEYPFRPPQMSFKTKLWHPNVSSQTVRVAVTHSQFTVLTHFRELFASILWAQPGHQSLLLNQLSSPYNRSSAHPSRKIRKMLKSQACL